MNCISICKDGILNLEYHSCTMKDIFCKIVQRNEPAYIIAETDDMLAILDIEPATKGHTLIISKRHVLEINNLTKSEKEQHEHVRIRGIY